MSSTPSPQDGHAEETDPSVLGHGTGDDGLPGIEDYPPEQPLGVEDPSLLEGGAETRDDLRIRLWRESAPAPSEETGIRLEADTGNDPAEDSTGTAIAERASTTASPSAEEAAVDIVGEPGEYRDR